MYLTGGKYVSPVYIGMQSMGHTYLDKKADYHLSDAQVMGSTLLSGAGSMAIYGVARPFANKKLNETVKSLGGANAKYVIGLRAKDFLNSRLGNYASETLISATTMGTASYVDVWATHIVDAVVTGEKFDIDEVTKQANLSFAQGFIISAVMSPVIKATTTELPKLGRVNVKNSGIYFNKRFYDNNKKQIDLLVDSHLQGSSVKNNPVYQNLMRKAHIDPQQLRVQRQNEKNMSENSESVVQNFVEYDNMFKKGIFGRNPNEVIKRMRSIRDANRDFVNNDAYQIMNQSITRLQSKYTMTRKVDYSNKQKH